MAPEQEEGPRFLCDAMLGGLARWLRAAGYSAEFDPHFADGQLVRRALREQKVVLTSDEGILERYAVNQRLVQVLFVPRGLSVVQQLAHVLKHFALPLRPSHCMDCNGRLRAVPLGEVARRVPDKVQRMCEEFFVCRSCGKVFWRGTHWESISRRLARARQMAGEPDQQRAPEENGSGG